MTSTLPHHAIVTGASSGIGLEVAKRLLSEGWIVVAVSRNLDTLRAALPTEHLDSTALPIAHDLSTQAGREACATEALNLLHCELDLLVNNAGGAIVGVPLERLTYEQFRVDMERNLNSTFVLTQRCVPALEKRKGAVVNVSSRKSQRAVNGSTGYCVSKAATDHLTRCCALELASKGIRVNAVNPSTVCTDIGVESMGKEGWEAHLQAAPKNIPLGRVGLPSDVAEVILMLGSRKTAGWVTGQTIMLDGGKTLL